ncbi:MAG: PPC domain-containing protein [Deltaproteobacteria bacterium]|nr:PPC domain-containing protein [Deltaproteobacteria bacterium]
MKISRTLLIACGLVATTACGDDGAGKGGDTTADTTSDTTTSTATATDASTSTDTGDTSTPTCDKSGITIVEQYMEYESGVTRYEGYTAGETFDALLIQFYPPLSGGESPLDGPGNYPIGANVDDQNFSTCTTCILAYEGCGAETCEKIYFATGGTIQVTEFDPEGFVFKGTVTDLVLAEVTIDDDNVSHPVAGGDTWCVATSPFDTTPECTEDIDCTEAGKNVCDTTTLTCVGCVTGFDCSAQSPACDQGTQTCVAGFDDCTDDDGAEPNDGPLGATALTLGQATAGATCDGVTGQEVDWYTFTIASEQTLSAKVTWTEADASFFVLFIDSEQRIVGQAGETGELVDERVVGIAAPGTYYAVVLPSDTSKVGAGKAAVAYSLTVTATTPECSSTIKCAAGATPTCDLDRGKCVACVSSFDCKEAASPACVFDEAEVASCAKIDVCTGDDAPDADDGPAVATALTVGAAATAAKICGEDGKASEFERDWFKFEATAGADITVTVAWEGEPDLDVAVYDATGELVEEALFEQPEVLELVDLAAGTYYIEVLSYDGAETAALAYTIQAAVTAP